ncbi:unnamed protein product [marine sediment metagenome]|uniref:Uncharacterized protein n=1 Tax=marine sediment metagenome TaxID=412755 RepID=X1UFE6_9ZZZZ
MSIKLIDGVPVQATTIDGIDADAVCSETEIDDKIAAALLLKINTGTWVGDNAGNKAIAHGLGVIPKLVLISSITSGSMGWVHGTINRNTFQDSYANVANWDATNFYVSKITCNMNLPGITYHFVAFG